ncbi:MAG: hypothetical protein P1Q69_19380, partial [Candidatus Thorarchaeota archaeon]|nr:hypothetical protein [Candidatus Thorarchaeota archaeon]
MHIAHVCPFVGEQYGGSERFVVNISKYQAKENDVHIYTTTRYIDCVGTRVIDGITIHRLYSPASIWNVEPISFALRRIANSKADIYH